MDSTTRGLAAPQPLSVVKGPVASPPRAAAPGAFEALFEAEYASVVRVAARVLQERSAAEDIAQEVFLDFHLRYPNGHQTAAGWLRLAAAHLALNRIRGDRRRSRRELGIGEEHPTQETPETEALASETRQEVQQALGRIKRRQAALLVLRYSGLSYAEVANALSIPVSQVGVRLRRAEAALRKEVDRDQAVPSN
ncbi:MAG TPA: sigma-70 family RNA polymerase sigma factor [Candidatus Acidoferrales bacterium]|nr:sigma-70 family RNA polymerase sigma factor [Candidatus Acidoferrales bacterium]